MKKSKPTAVNLGTHKSLGKRLLDNWQLYVMLLIPVLLTIIYKYIPMYGIQIAFRDYKASKGFTGSEWIGLEWFRRFFSAPTFGRMIKNTLLLSFYSLLWGFPIPIILALMMNQLRFHRFKRMTQTVLYAPHFISTMVICGMIRIFLSPSGGLINLIAGTSKIFPRHPQGSVRGGESGRSVFVPENYPYRYTGTDFNYGVESDYERRWTDECRFRESMALAD